jgi:hypothetical protein
VVVVGLWLGFVDEVVVGWWVVSGVVLERGGDERVREFICNVGGVEFIFEGE